MSTRGKSAFDRTAAFLGLVVLSPLLLVVSLLIRSRLGAPILFRQSRPGLGGRPFTIYKFRTMRDATGPDGRPLPDSERLTPLGNVLRKTSVDEFPQLLNVLRGDMSLVGPRPLLLEYLPLYSEEQARRHDVRPGVTGLAQVSGRNNLSWEEKFELDSYYAEHCCWKLDLTILARTVARLFRREGISAPGHVTAPPFQGVRPAAGPDRAEGPAT